MAFNFDRFLSRILPLMLKTCSEATQEIRMVSRSLAIVDKIGNVILCFLHQSNISNLLISGYSTNKYWWFVSLKACNSYLIICKDDESSSISCQEYHIEEDSVEDDVGSNA